VDNKLDFEHRAPPANCRVRSYRLRDRFAKYRLIAAFHAAGQEEEQGINLWLMSCPVIGWGVD
jgi:predicted enzyme involved in methoxymalonyl-ACP biosynthesis